jgi:UDP-N-acetylmuramyl pentapeptide synthase
LHNDTRSHSPAICSAVALKGENFDAHDFLAQAKSVSGAATAIAEAWPDSAPRPAGPPSGRHQKAALTALARTGGGSFTCR